MVLVGALILSGAVNTAIVGANGVLSRMVEDGVLTTWFKKPQKKYGTSYRVINMIALLQVLTIIASRGNVYLLASLYAFGVIWSFSFMSLAVLVLRYTLPQKREWKVPGNFHIRGVEIPVGLGLISIVLFSTALVNLFTKQIGHHCRREFQRRVLRGAHGFRTCGRKATCTPASRDWSSSTSPPTPNSSAQAMEVRPGNILVAVRDPQQPLLFARRAGTSRHHENRRGGDDRAHLPSRASFSGTLEMETRRSSTSTSRSCLPPWCPSAEKEGKHVSLVVVPTNDVFEGIVATAQRLNSSVVVCGLSNKLTADEQGKLTGDAWERLPEPRPRLTLVVVGQDGRKHEYQLGPHRPRVRKEDVDLCTACGGKRPATRSSASCTTTTC